MNFYKNINDVHEMVKCKYCQRAVYVTRIQNRL